MSLEGYTGPTSGRITVGGDGPAKIDRFYDKPLSRDEVEATKWFTDLSPNEQLREVRRLKWNGDQSAKGAKNWMEIAHRQREEIEQLEAKLATFTPEGFTLPPAAKDLLDHATAHGWKTGRAWHVDEEDPTVASFQIIIGHGGWTFNHLRWACYTDGSGRMVSRGLVRSPRSDWRDAPSLKKIKVIITEEGTN